MWSLLPCASVRFDPVSTAPFWSASTYVTLGLCGFHSLGLEFGFHQPHHHRPAYTSSNSIQMVNESLALLVSSIVGCTAAKIAAADAHSTRFADTAASERGWIQLGHHVCLQNLPPCCSIHMLKAINQAHSLIMYFPSSSKLHTRGSQELNARKSCKILQ